MSLYGNHFDGEQAAELAEIAKDRALDLAWSLLNPDELGFQATPAIRDEARKVFGILPCETVGKE